MNDQRLMEICKQAFELFPGPDAWRSDRRQYGRVDHSQHPDITRRRLVGDCEDWARLFVDELVKLGVDAHRISRIQRLVLTRARSFRREMHQWVEVDLDDPVRVAVLDILNAGVVVVDRPYVYKPKE